MSEDPLWDSLQELGKTRPVWWRAEYADCCLLQIAAELDAIRQLLMVLTTSQSLPESVRLDPKYLGS